MYYFLKISKTITKVKHISRNLKMAVICSIKPYFNSTNGHCLWKDVETVYGIVE